MAWRRRPATAPVIPAAPVAVPDGNDTRRAALQASWRRDRSVARRRLAVRWAIWIVLRYLLPAVLVLAAVAFAWPWVVPRVLDLAEHMRRPAPPPASVQEVPEVVLRLDTQLQVPSGAASAAGPVASSRPSPR